MTGAPLPAAAVQVTVAVASPGCAVGEPGADGTPTGTGPVVVAGPVPMPLVTATAKVYVVPLVSPVTVCWLPGSVKTRAAWGTPPTDGVMTEPVIGEPFAAGGHHDSVAWPSPPWAIRKVGAAGGPAGVTLLDAGEAGPVPAALMAATRNV